MYCLNTYNQLPLFDTDRGGEAGEAIEFANDRLRDSSAGLVFNREEHSYMLGNRRLTSVSDIVKLFKPFDQMAAAEATAKNPTSEYFGWDVPNIIKAWEDIADKGTIVHSFGEACYDIKKGILPEEEYLARLTTRGLEASSAKEEAVARWWDSLDLSRYVLVAKETQIANPLMGYAGTFDLLMYDLMEHHYVLRDYKTNRKLMGNPKTSGKLGAPLSMIRGDNHGKYTLQQNLYKIQLENIGIHVGRMELIWLKDNGTSEDVPVQDYETIVRFAMRNLKLNNLKIKS